MVLFFFNPPSLPLSSFKGRLIALGKCVAINSSLLLTSIIDVGCLFISNTASLVLIALLSPNNNFGKNNRTPDSNINKTKKKLVIKKSKATSFQTITFTY